MRIHKDDAMNHTIESEIAMRGILVMVRTSWSEDGSQKSFDAVDNAKIDINLHTSGEQVTIVPKRGLQQISDATMFSDNSSFIIRKENGETWHMFAIEWNGDGDSAIHMRPNSRYSINLSCSKKVMVEVNAIKDESTSTLIRTHSIMAIDASQQKEQVMQVENGVIAGVTVPIWFNPSDMDFKLIISHENGEDIELGEHDLIYMALSNDETKYIELDDDMLVSETYANNQLSIPLLNSSSPVRKIRFINNTNSRRELILTTLRSI